MPYDRGDPGQRVDAMGGRVGGFGAILGCAGAESPRRQARRLSARGHYVAAGFTSHLRRGGPDARGLAKMLGMLRLGGQFLRVKLAERSDPRCHFDDITAIKAARPDWFRDDLGTLFALLAGGRIHPHIAGVFPPERAAQAHALIEAGQVTGRLVLDMR